MRRPRRFAAFAGAATVVLATTGGAALAPMASGTAAAAGLPSPKADLVVDAGTGRILIGDNIHQAIHPASTAKIMTALTAAERLCPGATVRANARDAGVETMRIGLPIDKPWPVDQMMASMMMVSANDAAYAIADTVGGSLDGFAADQAATARQLGMRDSTLGDPAGLDDATSYKGGPSMSAYDLGIATRNALSVPEIAKWAALHDYSFVDPSGVSHQLVNHNKMLPGGAYAYAGAIGFKTGFTNQAQHSLVAVATRNGRTIIAVILGAPDAGYLEAASLLDAGFATAPDTRGTGQTLPAVAVSRCSERRADQVAFAKLGTSAKGSVPPSASAVTVPSVIPALDQPALAAAASAHPRTAATSSTHHSPGPLRPRNIVILLVVALAGVIGFRRRAVKRQRARRLARRKQRISAMRSGGLPVVDGRYRSGSRIGPPVESHVRVRPVRRTVDRSGTA
jgi:serine-type D-Ala-D-Ala carboxypeptidase (penicillin-binding protein 5/6)